jgi:hypothetical protein
MNNYGCVKQTLARPLPGSTFGNNRHGARDNEGHAFDDPKWSLLYVVELYSRYQKQGLRSADQDCGEVLALVRYTRQFPCRSLRYCAKEGRESITSEVNPECMGPKLSW